MRSSNKIVYAFIDSQNLNLGTLHVDWKLDFSKFRLFLRNKYHVEKAYLFIGYIKENEKLYKKLERYGYELIYKPVTRVKGQIKGNVDAELVLTVMDQIKNFDTAIIVSGDGDFYCLVRYLWERNKLYKIITPNAKYSSLLKEFGQYIVNISLSRKSLEKSRGHSRGKQC